MFTLKMIPIWVVAILALTPFGFFLMPVFAGIAIIGGLATLINGIRGNTSGVGSIG
jgi:hypothetical protein